MKLSFLFLLLVVPISAQSAKYGHDGKYVLPDKSLTPGASDPTIVADLSKKPHMIGGVEHNLCAPDFRTGPFRHTSEALKKQVCKEYGVSDCPKDGAMEIDHLIDLDDGGLDTLKDLWVQPAPDYHVKDKLEVELGGPRGLVCQGKITLKEAQACISSDWVVCAKKIGGLK